MLDFVASDVCEQEEAQEAALLELEEELVEEKDDAIPKASEVNGKSEEQIDVVEVLENTEEETKEGKDETVEPKEIATETNPAPAFADQYQKKGGVLGERSEAISDVRKAISITDRFLYLKELFGNNMDTFNDALDEVNKAESMHQAVVYLGQFNWEDNETSQQFMRLVSRRFV